MRLFRCQACGQLLYFENTLCERCQHALGYDPARNVLLALDPAGDRLVPAGEGADGPHFRRCANAEPAGCNWLVPASEPGDYCAACRHNRTVPDLSVAENLLPWRILETAKRRLFYALIRLRLPLRTRAEDPVHGLAFDFLADPPAAPKVMTGHDNGLITIALREGDAAERERTRAQMGELYRTPLGHFRHEVGHHYWDILVRDGGHLEQFRAVFGDERQDYGEALQAHYNRADDGSWRESFVSLYASSHPWEDFAETWAHYLHIVDALEMASAFGLSINPRVSRDDSMAAEISGDAYRAPSIESLIEDWLPLTYAVNSLNRAMGQPDLYPFVLTPAVTGKLGFIHDLTHGGLAQAAPAG